MFRITIICIFITGSLLYAKESHSPVYPHEILTALQPSIKKGWIIKSDLQNIIITRDEQVTLLNPIGLPLMRDKDELLKKYGLKIDYSISLEFKDRITDEQYEKMKAKRDAAIQKIKDNPELQGKITGSLIQKEIRNHKLPVYFNSKFSVYLQRTDAYPLEVYPESADQEINMIFKILSRNLKKYNDIYNYH